MKAKRFVRRRYHPMLSYYIGSEIVSKQETRTIESRVAGVYGRPELNSEREEVDVPLAMTVADAQERFSRKESFAFITPEGKAGFQDADSYERNADKQPDWTRVTESYDRIVRQRALRYV